MPFTVSFFPLHAPSTPTASFHFKPPVAQSLRVLYQHIHLEREVGRHRSGEEVLQDRAATFIAETVPITHAALEKAGNYTTRLLSNY